ncbi:MAG TPA: potassium-transporting ATPase subunit C [Mycobacteriales bacterium]|jgi:K+-transporting ATPase ATPase C chain
MATRLPGWLRQHLAAVRALLVLTVLVGLAYPLVVTGIAQLPGLKSKADGSIVTADGRDVGSSRIGQAFTDDKGDAIPKYFQSRPSAAGDGYDPTATSASNLGPESIVDVPDDPATAEDDSKPSLLTQVCARSLAVGKLEGVDGARPYCTPGGVGAVLAVFHAGPGYAGGVTRVVSVNEYCDTTPTPFLTTYQGVAVECHRPGEDLSRGQVVPIRGNAPANPAVPADAVTASGSGLDPDISPAYADLQAPRVAKIRNLPVDRVRQLIRDHTEERALGFLGEPGVNVLQLNMDLDRTAPVT